MKKGTSMPYWLYVVVLVLGLIAIALFIGLVVKARGADAGVFRTIEGALGIG
jgi:hypothetical protein